MAKENLPIVPANNEAELHVASETTLVAEPEQEATHSGLNVHDILFTLFRHKWKIIFFGLIGLAVAAAIYVLVPPVYESEAKLLVRYVVDRSAVDGLDPQVKTPSPENSTLINSEVQILTSSDLVHQVAESIGPAKLLPDSPNPTVESAVAYIYANLNVSVVKDTNIISVIFTSTNPRLTMPVVQELVKQYFDKHLEVHRSTGAFDFVKQEAAELKKELAQTEADLRVLREGAGIISLTETKSDLAIELGKTQQELDTAEADLAVQETRVTDLAKTSSAAENKPAKTPAQPQPVSAEIVQKYQSLIAMLAGLQKSQSELLSRYTPQNPIVKTKQTQIESLEKQCVELENQYPGLLSTASIPTSTSIEGIQTFQTNIESEGALLAGLKTKVAALKARMSNLQTRVKTISDVAPRIEELERKAEVEEINYKHSEASLEKARIDETLDPSRMPNISIVQKASSPSTVKRNIEKVVVGIAGAGFALGIGLALLIELLLDPTIKRSLELENRLHIPLLITIPFLSGAHRQLRLWDGKGNPENGDGDTWEKEAGQTGTQALIRPFCEAIRDRLGVFFEVNNMAFKPKLIGVTSLAKSAGSSSIATGLTDALVEFCEGNKVVLVDKPMASKRFYDQITEFKRSDLDYVVFDMPSLGDTSSTVPLAGFMDTILLVVEAEKSNRQAVKRAYAQLASRTKVSVIFNKSRSYGPKWLES